MRITNNPTPQYLNNNKKTMAHTNKNFADVLQEKIIQTDKPQTPATVTADNVGIYTKSAAANKVKSVYDIPKFEWHPTLQKAMQASEELDTTGMTQAEIVNKVESIFSDYLGKDFLDIYKVYAGVCGGSAYDCIIGFGVAIHMFFNTTLQRTHDIPFPNSQINIERKGYTGMSEAEMRAAIRKQFPENMTLRDNLLMAWELNAVGLEGAIGIATSTHINTMLAYSLFPTLPNGIGSNERFVIKNIYDTMLDQPASFDAMKLNVQSYARSDGLWFYHYDYNSLSSASLSVLLEHLLSSFGGSLYMADDLMKMLEGIQKVV
jgi:hypothetical protein